MERKAGPARIKLGSVSTAARLLKAFSDDDYELGISELAKRLGLAKSTVHRLASTLVDERLLERNPQDDKYRLGLLMFELGSRVRRKMDVSAEARPLLKTLAESTGETVHLAVVDQNSIIYMNRIESRRAIRTGSDLGTRAPLHCTGVGKAWLAFQPEEVVDQVVAAGLPSRTANTFTEAKALRHELAGVRVRGYAIEDEEMEIGLRSVAAPVRNHAGYVVAAIGIAGPAPRLTRKIMLAHARELLSATDAVSQRLGHQPELARKRA
jgi:IclR family KDG regulon transcriptional repressor